jgi:N-carbamoyl-L-amino-acid hydrolase
VTDVEALLAQIAEIGAAAGGGFRRLAWTDEDARLAQWFAGACAERGLEVGTDRCGNQWAWWGDPDAEFALATEAAPAAQADNADDADGEGGNAADGDSQEAGAEDPPVSDVDPEPAAPVADGTLPYGGIVTGSHLDSVPGGGAYDGPLGVATALAAIDELKAQDFTPRRAIGVVRFVDEEGARFGVPCTGSRLLTGQLEPGDVLVRTDDDGVSYGEAAAKAGVDIEAIGRDDEALRRIGAFVEVHVEQGFTLAAEEVDAPLGVCGLVRPHGRWRVELRGRADHAGTARFVDRNDPMIELARLVTTVRSVASRQDALATVGKVEVQPNVPNAVPSRVLAWVDIRADTPGQVRSVASEIKTFGFDLEQESWTPATPLGGPLTDRVSRVAGQVAGEDLPVLATGAGHDAAVLATAGIPASMIFVRNPTGVSHAPDEAVRPEDVALAVRSLAAVLADLCR